MNYIFVSGGIISGLGKGASAASIAYLIEKQGYKVSIIKCENYLNFDADRMNPVEHGDAFLTQDGYVCDMDMGTYERFLDKQISGKNYITMGQIYKSVVDKELAYYYGGKTVEPLGATIEELLIRFNEVVEREQPEFVVVELGGTVGEFQNHTYFELSKILKYRLGNNVQHVHLSLVPYISTLGEPKTKPVHLSCDLLMKEGIIPDFLVIRSEKPIDKKRLGKLSSSTFVAEDNIILNPDLDTIYKIPKIFNEQKISQKILQKFGLNYKNEVKIPEIDEILDNISKSKYGKTLTIAIVGKYFATGDYVLRDSYFALFEALEHAQYRQHYNVKVIDINSELPEEKIFEKLKAVDGIIVPIGWGGRGVEGKISAIKYARENKIPYLGLCYGMQLACIEWARNVLKLEDADTEENNVEAKNKIIHLIPENEKYVKITSKGVFMRRGGYDCIVKKGSLVHEIYGDLNVNERHRHRYEFNNDYREIFEKSGFVFAGTSPDNFFVEFIELPRSIHPFFVATQAHPEYKSTPFNPHPIFLRFLKESAENKRA